MDEYVHMAKNGDKDAFTLIFLELQNDLYNIAKSRLKDDNIVSDVIQETIIIVYRNIKNLKKDTSLKSWIIKILINECNKSYNKKTKNNVISIDDWSEKINNGGQVDISFTPESNNLDFYSLLKSLSYKERLVITLYYNQEYTSKEISQMLKIKENTIKSIIKRTKEKIKNNLEGGNSCKIASMI